MLPGTSSCVTAWDELEEVTYAPPEDASELAARVPAGEAGGQTEGLLGSRTLPTLARPSKENSRHLLFFAGTLAIAFSMTWVVRLK